MRDIYKRFGRRYGFPLLALVLIAAVVPVGVGVTVSRLYGTNPELWHSAELQTDIQAAMTEAEPSETLAVLTEPVTEPTAAVTEPPVTEPPVAEPPVAEPPETSMIGDVPFYSQRSLLPTGCELVSAKMVLEFYTGEEIPIQEIIDRVKCQYPQDVDGKSCAPHPSQAFIGDPWDPVSYGCFAAVICDMMNELLPAGYTAEETTGTSVAELAETYIPQGQPVLLWATIAMIDSYPHGGWYLLGDDGKPTDEWYEWRASEHCLVLIGYDAEYYYFNDPYSWNGCTKFSRELVEKRHAEIGGYSAVVQKNDAFRGGGGENPHT